MPHISLSGVSESSAARLGELNTGRSDVIYPVYRCTKETASIVIIT